MQAGVCWEVYVLWFTAQLSGSVIQAMYMTCTMPSYAPVPRLRYFFCCVFISTVPQSKKLKIKYRFISGKIIHKCRVLNCNVWLSEGSHPEAHSIRFWITFLKLDYAFDGISFISIVRFIHHVGLNQKFEIPHFVAAFMSKMMANLGNFTQPPFGDSTVHCFSSFPLTAKPRCLTL